MQTKIKWQGQHSRTLHERQGGRQGGVWSPAAYKIFINSLCNSNGSNETKVTSSATVGAPQKIEPIRAPSFSVS
jgi:hypothetical protein